MWKALRYVGFLVVLIISGFVFIANLSVASYRYECVGEVVNRQSTSPVTVFIKVERYRWWVGLWGDSDGSLYVEVPNGFVRYFGDLRELGEQTQIFDFDGRLQGNFSSLSRILALDLPNGMFDGRCELLGGGR